MTRSELLSRATARFEAASPERWVFVAFLFADLRCDDALLESLLELELRDDADDDDDDDDCRLLLLLLFRFFCLDFNLSTKCYVIN